MPTEPLLTEADHVLVAFDGPVAELPETNTVANRLRVMVKGGRLPRKVARTRDPFVVIEYAMGIGPATGQAVYAQLCRIESELVAGATVTPGVRDAMAAMAAAGTHVSVISSLDSGAVRTFLVLHGLDTYVRHMVARTGPDRDVLPPAPDLVQTALRERAAASTVFVGSTDKDLAAARAAGVDTYRHRRAADGSAWPSYTGM